MFQYENYEVCFAYKEYPVFVIQDVFGVQMPRKYQNFGEKLRVTICSINDLDVGMTAAWGVAVCSPADNFVKDTGRKVSLVDALKTFEDEETRRQFWEHYFAAQRGEKVQ